MGVALKARRQLSALHAAEAKVRNGRKIRSFIAAGVVLARGG